MGRQHQGMDRPGVRQVPGGSGEHGRMEETGCEIICAAPTTLVVKEWKIMLMMAYARLFKSSILPLPVDRFQSCFVPP